MSLDGDEKDGSFSVRRFAGILGKQLMNMALAMSSTGMPLIFHHQILNKHNTYSLTSSSTLSPNEDEIADNNNPKKVEVVGLDGNGKNHELTKNNVMKVQRRSGKKYTASLKCDECEKRGAFMCWTCKVGICYHPNESDGGFCFRNHCRCIPLTNLNDNGRGTMRRLLWTPFDD